MFRVFDYFWAPLVPDHNLVPQECLQQVYIIYGSAAFETSKSDGTFGGQHCL